MTRDISFTINADYTGTTIRNWAEISDASNNLDEPDQDSTPDNTNFDGAGETVDLNDDNVISEDGLNGGEEEDHDPTDIDVDQTYDLALTKEETSTGPYMPGSDVEFTITVTNEGSLPAADVIVTDRPQLGLSYTSPTATANVTDNGDGTFTIGSLARG